MVNYHLAPGLPPLNGNGNPNNVVNGTKGQTYVDDLNGTIYVNINGLINGWMVV